MRVIRNMIVLLLPLLMGACALGDTPKPTPTALPPLTLTPPPALTFAGDCNFTPKLEEWLQLTTQLLADFQTAMNSASTLSRPEAYDKVTLMAALRDSAAAAPAPDCAATVHVALVDAFNQGVSALQSYVNGETTDTSKTIAAVNNQLDQIAATQKQLTERMQNQYQTLARQLTLTPQKK